MRRALCLLLAATLLLVPLQPAEATTLTFDGKLEVEYNPDSLTLRPGDIGAVYILVRNRSDQRLYIQVDVSRTDAPGASTPEIMNQMFILEPGGVDQVVMTVESRAHLQQDPDISDVSITFRWGENATTIDGGAFRLNDPRYVNWIEYDVEDDFSDQWARVVGLIVAGVFAVVVVALIAIVVRRRRWRMSDGPSADPYGEGPQGRKDVLLVRHTPSTTIIDDIEDASYDPLRETRPDDPHRLGRPPPY